MISELTFSKKFTSFWNQLLPNSHNFIRIINGSLAENVYQPLPESSNRTNNVFVNECAFNLYGALQKGSIKESLFVSSDIFHSQEFNIIFEYTEKYLKKFNYGSNFQLPLDITEYNTIREISKNIFQRYRSFDELEVSPLFMGCGIINNSYGDIYYPDNLVEIKSGDRKFSIYDLRQLLVYLTLNFFSKKSRSIKKFEIFNPRMGISYNDTVVNLCRELAFIQPEELYFLIMNSITDENFIISEMQN
ncbi:hypothetical protein CYR40_06760 [Chimaeribacter arupi]|uniref:hypothetical protein n=1 Tax=Chimaeribacter arupi TaxID=2060066 RepID=UPI000C797E6C|nr:hypothetical protein [Chimaeribacter arupi]PLR48275.1 hypothetical protein CYR40_06760 [Chimaeribacter arupi]